MQEGNKRKAQQIHSQSKWLSRLPVFWSWLQAASLQMEIKLDSAPMPPKELFARVLIFWPQTEQSAEASKLVWNALYILISLSRLGRANSFWVMSS
jgi:hypothetical protein